MVANAATAAHCLVKTHLARVSDRVECIDSDYKHNNENDEGDHTSNPGKNLERSSGLSASRNEHDTSNDTNNEAACDKKDWRRLVTVILCRWAATATTIYPNVQSYQDQGVNQALKK